MTHPDFQATSESSHLEQYYRRLIDQQASFDDIKRAIWEILEKVGNEYDCFWISHAWAESLIRGRTVSKKNFPFGSRMDIRRDREWRQQESDYTGIHLSHGAEPYVFTRWTSGKDHNFPPREYKLMSDIENSQQLQTFLDKLPDGSLVMILLNLDWDREHHALLATKINGHVLFIDNSMEPGPWIKSRQEMKTEVLDKGCYVYVYPEKIHRFEDEKTSGDHK